jgi:hypothetical protein
MSTENTPRPLSRRDFLKLVGAGLASLAFTQLPKDWQKIGNSPENEGTFAAGNPEFLPDKTIEIEGKFRPNKPITIYNFPLRNDLTFDPKQKIFPRFLFLPRQLPSRQPASPKAYRPPQHHGNQ